MKSTIVMALFDIGRDKWENFTMSYHTYFWWMRNTLSLDTNMVIYTDGTYEKEIIEFRSEVDPNLKKTKIVNIKLEDTEGYKIFNTPLENLMYSEEFKNKISFQVPEMTKPLYNVVMFSKLYYILDAKQNNYFDTDWYIWADAGGLRENIENYYKNIWPSQEKISKLDQNKVVFFSHRDSINIQDKEYYALSQTRFIQGTCFLVPNIAIEKITQDFTNTAIECIRSKYIGSDEKIFDLTYIKNPSDYHLIKCDWREYYKIFSKDIKKVFLDLGCHRCQGLHHFINHELKIDTSWEIHTFEPNPLIDIDNCTNQFPKHNITKHRSAVWTKNGKIVFKQYGNDGTSQGSLIADTQGDKTYGDYYSETEIQCIDLYEFIKSFPENSEIYIKMDVEWAEYELIPYMLKMGWPKNIKKIWIEWHTAGDEKYKETIKQLTDQIKSNGTVAIDWH